MFSGISQEAVAGMSNEQVRWLNNIKRAVYQCDKGSQSNEVEDECLASLCRGVETAQKLRRSLQGVPVPELKRNSKKHFIDFIELEFPTKVVRVYGQKAQEGVAPHPPYSEMIYDVRCKAVHENENLNASENPCSEIQVDWHLPDTHGGQTINNVHYVNGRMLVMRLRGILAKFVMGIDSIGSGSLNIDLFPPIGSIKPE